MKWGDIGNWLFGSSGKTEQLPTKNPQQMQFLAQLLGMLGPQGGLGQGFGESTDYLRQLMDPNSQAINQFSQPYMQQFEQQTIPQLAERFAGAGAMGGGLSSSGFGQALSAAGGNLQTQLAALKAGLGQQAANQLMGQYGSMTGQAMGVQPFGYTYQPGQQGFLPQLLAAYMKGGMPGI